MDTYSHRLDPAKTVRNTMTGKIGVVTVLFESGAVLADFFASIESQTHKNFVVYCVDNASGDGSAGMCAQRGSPYVTIENGRNLGVAAGNNIGIRAAMDAGCEYVLLLNNDVSFGQHMFQQLLDGLHQHSADMVTPMIYCAEPPDLVWSAGGAFRRLAGYRTFHYGFRARDLGQFAKNRRVEYAPTCCVLIRTDLFRTVGLMDEKYFVYWDDADWMLRAKRAGTSLWYVSEARLWHKEGSLTGGGESDFAIRYGARNMAYFLYKNVNRAVAITLRIGYCSYYLLNLLLPQRRKKASLRLHSWREGLELYRSAFEGSRNKNTNAPITSRGSLHRASPASSEDK